MLFFLLIVGFLVVRGLINYTKTGRAIPALYLSTAHKQALIRYFEFYQKLPPTSKKIFEKKVMRFISDKRFIPRSMPEVTPEMKALIAASAIQLTFGLPNVYMSFFQNIVVYSDDYYSVINKRHHKGEVNPKYRAIVISWKSFVSGYIKKDGRNLGLHEMAHALRLENRIRNHEFGFFDEEALNNWEQVAHRTMQEIKEGKETFFREYGGTNQEEFFAVAIENYFERPVKLKEKHPHIYQSLCHLLNQDPVNLESA